MKLGGLYSAKDTERAIKATRVVPKTVTLVDPNTGVIWGKRTIYSK